LLSVAIQRRERVGAAHMQYFVSIGAGWNRERRYRTDFFFLQPETRACETANSYY